MSPVILTVLRFGLDVTLKVTLLLVLAELTLLAARRSPAAVRHSLAVFALIGTLALPIATLLVPRWEIPIVPSLLPEKAEIEFHSAGKPGMASPLANSKTGSDEATSWRAPKSSPARRASTAAAGARPAFISPRTSGAAALKLPSAVVWMSWLPLIWAFGAALGIARLISGFVRVRAIARDAVRVWDLDWMLAKQELSGRLGIDRPVALLASERVPVAMTVGVRRPVLLLAANAERWPAERRRVVLLHELAHIERRDWMALLIAEIARSLYWFHPLVWVGVGQARRDCEKACDDVVLESGTKPSVYAAHLLGIVRSLQAARQRLLPAVPMARPSQFEGRMRAILEAGRDRRRISAFEKGLAVAGVLGIVLAVAALQPWATCPNQRAAFLRHLQAVPLGLVPVVAGEEKSSPREPRRKSVEAPALAPAVYPGGPKKSDPVAPIRAHGTCKGLRDGVEGGIEGGVFEGVPGSVVAAIAEGVTEGVAEGAAKGVKGAIEDGAAEGIAEGIDDGVAEGVEEKTPAPKPASAPVTARRVEVATLEKASHLDGRTGSDWFSRGMKLHNERRYEEAIGAFQKSIDLGHREGTASYNIACGYARLGKSVEAMEWLRRAGDAGFDLKSHIKHDDDLDSLRNLAEFRELAGSLKSDDAAAAERRLARLAERPSTKGEAFYCVGKELLAVESFAAAAEAFQRSADAGYRVGTSLYNEACAFARDGRSEEALDLLEKALLAGFDDAGLVRRDDDLDNIRSEDKYKELESLAQDLSLSLPSGNLDFLGYGRHQWHKVIGHYRDVAQTHPRVGRAWFNLGYAGIRGGAYEEATQALEQALALGYRKPTTMYNLACSYALRGERDKAFNWLFQSLDAGFDGGKIDRDRDLDSLHGDPRFRTAVEKSES
jgi:beta-lactamase regulating signal transducer with metallopeptidase domain/tetratricopeptide (TPR) repeat protein